MLIIFLRDDEESPVFFHFFSAFARTKEEGEGINGFGNDE